MLYAGDAPTPDVTTEPYEIPEKRIASDAGHNTAMSSVLVTGGSGFVATHCILQLLASAFRGTVHQRGDSQSACHATATVVKSVPVRTVTPDAYATLNE